MFEGSEYERVIVNVETEHGSVQASMYVAAGHVDHVRDSGTQPDSR
jgi:hypothetical protein